MKVVKQMYAEATGSHMVREPAGLIEQAAGDSSTFSTDMRPARFTPRPDGLISLKGAKIIIDFAIADPNSKSRMVNSNTSGPDVDPSDAMTAATARKRNNYGVSPGSVNKTLQAIGVRQSLVARAVGKRSATTGQSALLPLSSGSGTDLVAGGTSSTPKFKVKEGLSFLPLVMQSSGRLGPEMLAFTNAIAHIYARNCLKPSGHSSDGSPS